jgi:hypothetical protein
VTAKGLRAHAFAGITLNMAIALVFTASHSHSTIPWLGLARSLFVIVLLIANFEGWGAVLQRANRAIGANSPVGSSATILKPSHFALLLVATAVALLGALQ